MFMSWECFCAQFGCGEHPLNMCAPHTQTTLGCGLRTDGVYNDSVSISVFNDAGVLVGRRFSADTNVFSCAGAPEQTAFSVRAGVFADEACRSTMCDCIDGGVVCP